MWNAFVLPPDVLMGLAEGGKGAEGLAFGWNELTGVLKLLGAVGWFGSISYITDLAFVFVGCCGILCATCIADQKVRRRDERHW